MVARIPLQVVPQQLFTPEVDRGQYFVSGRHLFGMVVRVPLQIVPQQLFVPEVGVPRGRHVFNVVVREVPPLQVVPQQLFVPGRWSSGRAI